VESALQWRGALFINEIVLAEESDEGLPDANGAPRYMSHFELYCEARHIHLDRGETHQNAPGTALLKPGRHAPLIVLKWNFYQVPKLLAVRLARRHRAPRCPASQSSRTIYRRKAADTFSHG
jgi:hypothetical protein